MLVARSGAVRVDATVWITLTTSLPNKQLSWSILGSGTLSNMSAATDANGIGKAMYTPDPGTEGSSVTIKVTYRNA